MALAFSFAVFGQEGKAGDHIDVRFRDGHKEKVEVVGWNSDGMVLKLQGIQKPRPFSWSDFDPESSAALRNRYLGAAKEAQGPMTLAGVRVKTKDGKTYEGLLVPGAPPTELWIKNRDGRSVVKLADVELNQEARYQLNEVYTEEEVYSFLLDLLRPREADDWEKMAVELMRAKCTDRAVTVIQFADVLRRSELPEGKLYKDLLRLRDKLQDIALKQIIFNIQEGFLAGHYEEALGQIDEIEKKIQSPEEEATRGELRRIRTELQELRDLSRDEQIIHEWYRLFDSLLRAQAFDHNQSYAVAADYVEKTLIRDIQTRVNERFNISPNDDSAKIVFEKRSVDVLFKHNYDETSWLSERPEARAAEPWWSQANDTQRFIILKGLAIEKHLAVVRADHKSCPTCGGRGLVDRAKFPESASGTCPTCVGLKQLRVLFYR